MIYNHITSNTFKSLEAICKIIAYGLFFPPAYSKFKRIRSWASVSEDKQHLKDDIPLTENSSPFSFSRQSELSPKNTHRAYLNSFANVLDAISIVSYWTDVVLMTYGYPYLSLFKALGALRPIRLLSLLPGTAVNIIFFLPHNEIYIYIYKEI